MVRSMTGATRARKLYSATLLGALYFGTAGLARADLLTNGNLNLDADGTPGPDGWSAWSFGPTAFAAYKTDGLADPFNEDGTPYINAGNYGDWWSSGGGWNQTVSGGAGTAYTFTADSATEGWDNAAGELRIIYLDEFGTELQRDVHNTANYQASLPWQTYTMTSVAPEGTAAVKAEFGTWGARGSVLWDNATLFVANVWNVDAGGDFAEPTNWLGGTPGGVDAAARFLGTITDDRSIAVNSAVTLGSVSFANAKSYSLAGTGSLRLEASASKALLDVQNGTQNINVPLTAASDTTIQVAAGSTLNINGAFSVLAGKALRPNGGGLVQYNSSVALEAGASIVFGNDTHATSLALASGSRAAIALRGANPAHVITVDALSVAADATLDIGDNKLVVNYAGTSPAATIRQSLATAYAAGAWNGPGIGSSAVKDGQHAVGYSESATAVTVQYTLNGDATLDGSVGFSDLVPLAQNYNLQSGATWAKGDFNYDGKVTFNDLVILAQNYGATSPTDVPANIASDWVLARSFVPEPTSLGVVGVGLLSLVRRRKLCL